MLVLYYTHTILFWLGLVSFNLSEGLLKQLHQYDLEHLPIEVCIARCLGSLNEASMFSRPFANQPAEETKSVKRPLELCIDYCSKQNSDYQQTNETVKQAYDNYSLNLICRDESSLNFKINLHTSPSNEKKQDTVVFVIIMHSSNISDKVFVYLSDENFFTIDGLTPNCTFNISALAVHSSNTYSVIASQQQYQTLRRGYTPGNVTDIKVSDFVEDTVNRTHLSAVLTWRPPPDLTCHYDIICFSPESADYDVQPLEIRDPRELFKYQLENLTFSSEYQVGIRARNSKNMKESALSWKTFRAPSCLEWHNHNFNICAPETPQNLSVEQAMIDRNIYTLNITWDAPTYQ
uniref:Fibronectin type-III domain-containing protein n=1 Tax=Stomoxys calcitrans TaxID=35570 RepID=A0A1I8P558_STOCA